MRRLPSWAGVALKLYAPAGLVAAALFSPPAVSFIPVLLAIAYLYLWWRGSLLANVLADFFAFFAVAILLSQQLGPLSAFASLPVLLPLARDLEAAAPHARVPSTTLPRYPTRAGEALPLTALVVLLAGGILAVPVLLLSASIALTFFAALFAISLLRIPARPVDEHTVFARILAGTSTSATVTVSPMTNFGAVLRLKPVGAWAAVSPSVLPMNTGPAQTEVTCAPPMAGPAVATCDAVVVDRWGLLQTRFQVSPVMLQVIPRARYAEWLARRYLAECRSGTLPLASSFATVRPLTGLRSGTEYYGSRVYQPGDSLKNIDWKRSIKFSELVSKEFAEARGQPAIMLVNLAALDAEEADKQAYNTVMTALSLAREQIPTTVAIYDDQDVRFISMSLRPQPLVARSLEVIQQIRVTGRPTRYLSPPDVKRLRANLLRLQSTDTEGARSLSRVMQLEYVRLRDKASVNPAAQALRAVAVRLPSRQWTVVAVSPLNHDAEAVQFMAGGYGTSGNPVVVV
jgi:uncharacterized protein (DUF58 family)